MKVFWHGFLARRKLFMRDEEVKEARFCSWKATEDEHDLQGWASGKDPWSELKKETLDSNF